MGIEETENVFLEDGRVSLLVFTFSFLLALSFPLL